MTENRLYKIRAGVLFLAAAFPLLMPHQISGAGILLFIIGGISVISSGNYGFNVKNFFIASAPFFIYLAALTNSEHLAPGIEIVQRKLLLLAIPLIFAFNINHITEKVRGKIFLVFEFAAFAIGLYANLMIRFKGLTITDPSVTDYSFIYRHALEHYSGLHPTYYAAILFFAAFLSLNNLIRDWKKRSENYMVWVELVLSVLLITMAGASAARAPLVAFGFILFVWSFMQCKNAGKTWLSFVILGLFATTLFLLPSTRSRILEVMDPDNFSAPLPGKDNGTNVRSGIYICNIETLKNNWLVGVGTGDVQIELNKCLTGLNPDIYARFDYNTHNEYLNAWFTAGIIGLIVFVLSLYFSFTHAVEHKKYTYLFFLTFMSICFITENYFERQAGVMLFTFFQSLFLFTDKETHHT